MKKRIGLCLLALCLLVGLTACGAGAKMDTRMTAEDVYTTAEEDGSVSGAAARRKVIVTASYEVQTQKFTEAVQQLETLVREQGGYVEKSDITGESTDNGSGYYVLRLPADKVEGFGAALAQVGAVQSHSRSEEDITDQYYDTDAHIKAKTAQRDRLLALIERAENLDTLLRLEQELAEVQGELDSLTGQLKRYDNQVSYATVRVRLYQTALTRSGNTPYGSRLAQAFTGTFSTALEVFKDIGIVLVWMLPFLLLVAVVVLIVLLATRRQRRQRKARRQQGRVYTPPTQPPAHTPEP